MPPAIFNGMSDLAWPIPLAPCALLKQCQVACCVAGAPPEQIHLSLPASKTASYMGVSWVTLDGETSVVQYGTDPDDLNIKAEGTVDTYTSAGWLGYCFYGYPSNLSQLPI